MKRLISILAVSLIGSIGFSNDTDLALAIHKATLPSLKGILNWKVGQETNSNITLMGMSGTMSAKVASETDKGFWLDQVISIMGQEQNIEALFSKEDGTILELKVNGQKQAPPEPPEMEVEEMKETNISVPAGKFDCTYAKLKDLKSNEVTEAWLNMKEIPINGMLKMIANQRGMQIVSELTSFKK